VQAQMVSSACSKRLLKRGRPVGVCAAMKHLPVIARGVALQRLPRLAATAGSSRAPWPRMAGHAGAPTLVGHSVAAPAWVGNAAGPAGAGPRGGGPGRTVGELSPSMTANGRTRLAARRRGAAQVRDERHLLHHQPARSGSPKLSEPLRPAHHSRRRGTRSAAHTVSRTSKCPHVTAAEARRQVCGRAETPSSRGDFQVKIVSPTPAGGVQPHGREKSWRAMAAFK